MINRLSALFLIVALVMIVRLYPFGELPGLQGANAFSLGFVILTGYLLGEILSSIKLPKITGYLIGGMFIGPYLAGLITHDSVADFQLIDQIALTLIALTAGGELRLEALKKCWRGIISITISQTIWLFALGTLSTWALINFTPWFGSYSTIAQWSVALIIGVIAIAQSPSTTIAIITETKSAGMCTDLALGVAVVKDVIVIVMYTCVLMTVGVMDQGMDALEWIKLFALAKEIVFSILFGILAGVFISYYLSRIRLDAILFLLAFCYLISIGAKSIHLDPLLVCVAAGIWVTNASSQGAELIETIEEGSLIIYVIFFCVAGASLNLGALAKMWPLALLLVGFRMIMVAFSTWFASRFSKLAIPSPRSYWMVFLPQAGVSLGLVALLRQDEFIWASDLKTLVIACIAINQILGPILMKYALVKSGEVGQHKRSRR